MNLKFKLNPKWCYHELLDKHEEEFWGAAWCGEQSFHVAGARTRAALACSVRLLVVYLAHKVSLSLSLSLSLLFSASGGPAHEPSVDSQ